MHCKAPAAVGVASSRVAPALPLRRPLTRKAKVAVHAGVEEDIYIGFPKGDYAPRAGRKGRIIKGDPAKFPDKADVGLFKGATGGWAGGEAALWELREEIQSELGGGSSEVQEYPQPKPQAGKAPIYIGFGKKPEEFQLRNTGGKGQVVYDEPEKYPGKEDVGFLAGATGGFAGGERGLKAFVQEGDVKVLKPGEAGGQPDSPVATGFVVIAAGATAGVLLSLVSPEIFEATGGSAAELGINLALGGVVFAALAALAVFLRSNTARA